MTADIYNLNYTIDEPMGLRFHPFDPRIYYNAYKICVDEKKHIYCQMDKICDQVFFKVDIPKHYFQDKYYSVYLAVANNNEIVELFEIHDNDSTICFNSGHFVNMLLFLDPLIVIKQNNMA